MKKSLMQIARKLFVSSLLLLLIVQIFLLPMFCEAYAESSDSNYIVIAKNKDDVKTIKDKYNLIDMENNILTGHISEYVADELEQKENVMCIEKDFNIESDNIEDVNIVKPIEQNWSIKAINAEERKNVTSTIKIAILDSGIDWTDEVIVKERKNFISGKTEETPLFDDLYGHGTSVASIIASKGLSSDVQGINSNVELYSARILDENLQAPISRVVEAIYWAIEKDVDIINISFGTPNYSKALETAIKAATERDILIIAAAGNHGNEVVNYPAAFEEVISVGSINASGEISEFSSKGAKVDIYAPGEAVLAHGNFGEDLVLSGTSLAAPHVTGVAALLLGENPTRSADFIRALITYSTKNINSGTTSGGILDYGFAVELCSVWNAEEISIGSIEQDRNNEDKIPQNDIPYEDFSDPIVDGSWGSDIHGMHYANQDMKAGALISDQSDYLAHMKTNPEFHGYSWHGSPSKPSFASGTCNYFANYKFLVLAAQKGAGDHTTVGSVQGLSSTCRNRMENGITNIKKTTAYKNASNKKAFLMGIAMHTAADTFAHSSFKKNGTSWVIIQHPDADDVMVINNRVNMAYHIMQNVVDRQNGKRSGINYCHDLHDEKTTAYYTNVTFKINKMKSFAQAAGVTNSTILGHFGKIS